MLAAQAVLLPRPARTPTRCSSWSGSPRRRGRAARSLSGGQRRRLDVALGIVGRPTLLFLDEPTTGFDPEARRQFWSLIRSLRELGTTMLLTTHYLDEAEALADRVGVIARGRLVEVAVPSALGGRETAPGGRQLDRGRRPPQRGDRHADGVRPGAGRPVRRRGARPGRRPADARGRLPADDRRAVMTTTTTDRASRCRRVASVYRTRASVELKEFFRQREAGRLHAAVPGDPARGLRRGPGLRHRRRRHLHPVLHGRDHRGRHPRRQPAEHGDQHRHRALRRHAEEPGRHADAEERLLRRQGRAGPRRHAC